jgi:hypothetical protein
MDAKIIYVLRTGLYSVVADLVFIRLGVELNNDDVVEWVANIRIIVKDKKITATQYGLKRTTEYGSGPVVSMNDSIESAICMVAIDCVNRRKSRLSSWWNNSYPPKSMDQASKIFNVVKELVPDMLDRTITGDISESDSTLEFLYKLGKLRDWKSGCCICLAQKIMGTTCGCGHTEITVFRPCGHSLCAQPCFRSWIKTYGIELPVKTMSSEGQVFEVVGAINDTLDGIDIPCPLCRGIVTRTFRAEECKFDIKDFDMEAAVKSVLEAI